MRDVTPPPDVSGDDQAPVGPGDTAPGHRGWRAAAARDRAYAPQHLRPNGHHGEPGADAGGDSRRVPDAASGASTRGPGTEGDGDADADESDDEAEQPKRRNWRRTIIEWVAVVGGGIAIALLVEAFLVQAFWIPSPSMVPTLEVGDRVLVDKLSYKFRDVHRGDLIVFERPPSASNGDADEIKDLIKRVIAVGGDTIEAREGLVYVNGEAVDEDYLEPGTPTDNLPRQTVPKGHVFVMGDNRTNSEDSRIFGAIDEDDIVGRAFIRVLPITDIGWL